MARVTHIKHARQRYAMVPVVDEAFSNSQATSIAFPPDPATLLALTTLPSVEVHSGPMPCVPTFV